jgi:integrase
MRTKVTIKQKPLSEGRESLYLNFAPKFTNPKTNKEIRKLYLKEFVYTKAKSTQDKTHNRNSLKFAEEMRLNFETQANKSIIYNVLETRELKQIKKEEADFIAFFEKYRNTKGGATKILYNSALLYFKRYTKDKPILFRDVTGTMLEGYKTYLKTAPSIKSKKVTLSNNTVSDYFGKLRAVIRQAQKEGYLKNDESINVKSIKTEETEKNFLTIAELNNISKTECKYPLLKRVALFSALTGLRFSDIRNLTWDRLEIDGENQYLKYSHQKTKSLSHRQPIPKQAFELMGEPKEAGGKVFEGLKYSSTENNAIKKWVLDAGITKKITFHCFRHTYATLQLEAGTDIYTVSKMLGHKDLKTTQVYAKIVDATKQKTTTAINLKY